jgi:isopenicillin-N epimerase
VSAHLRDLFLLDPHITFLNHGSFGATPRPVFETYQRWQRELERQPVEFLGRRFNDLMREARTSLATFIHADPDDIVYVPNATTGLNIVARSLRLEPGDEILTTDHEYGALDRTWRFISRKTGAMYKPQAIPVAGHHIRTILWNACGQPLRRARASCFSATSRRPPRSFFRSRKFVAARATPGSLASWMARTRWDNSIWMYKTLARIFIHQTRTSGFARRKDRRSSTRAVRCSPFIEPLIVSWGYESEKPSGSRFIDEQEWTGTRDIAAFLSVPAAIRFVQAHQWDQIRLQCHTLAQFAREQITNLTGLPPLSPDSIEWYVQMVTLPLPPCDPAQLKTRLYDEFCIEVPIVTWQNRQFIRISIQAYNTLEDVEKLVVALRKIFASRDL